MILCILLSGCYQKGTVAATGHWEPFLIAAVNVAVAGNINPVQFDKVVQLETDSYGRGYYVYRNAFMAEPIDIHIISQPTKNEQVFYYPDVCYLIHEDGDPDFTEAEIALFKQRNDWEAPPVERKMLSTGRTGYNDTVESMSDMEAKILTYFAPDTEGYRGAVNGLEILSSHEQLVVAKVFPPVTEEQNAVEDFSTYLIVYDKYLFRKVAAYQLVDEDQPIQDQISTFRSAWWASKNAE